MIGAGRLGSLLAGTAAGAVKLGFAVATIAGGLLASSGYLVLFLLDAATTVACALVV